ncbi:DUF6191 domain-containing protein [Actinoallomurus sp. NBC_01490]|uniref:DUF6191 domain-containing protein n=1 Tax=Actinoallomurus sp. NBC_01490 TaxID=2903557 RepID=UPI002E2F95C0|nr:DUF6191 domain-containing protein [Actinoallomurus sp. NBC_01490]
MAAIVSLMAVVSIPGLVLVLVVLASIDRMGRAARRRLRLPWRSPESGRPLAAPGLDEMQAIFYATKRHELDERRTSLMLRDEEGDGAPPRSEVDLHSGKAVIRKTR